MTALSPDGAPASGWDRPGMRLLWNPQDDRASVALVDRKTGDSFHIGVRRGERVLDVFHHPYASAALHGAAVAA